MRARALPPAPDDPSVRRLHALLAPERARLHAHDAAVVRLQRRLATIPAPTGAEAARARYVARLLVRLGLRDVRTDAAGNVLARQPGRAAGARPVVVCAHLDTVFPAGTPCVVRQEGARLVAPGIGDNGRGLAAMLAVAGVLAAGRVGLARDVLFAATTGEEGAGDLRGAKHLFATVPAAAAVVLDGPGDEQVVHAAVGARRFHAEVRGPGGHSWGAAGTPNPVHAVARLAARLAAWRPRDGGATTLAVTRIGGGLAVNAIPEQAWCEVDLRGTSTAALDAGERAVRTALRAAVAETSAERASWAEPLGARLTTIGDRPAGALDLAHPLVRRAEAATALVGRTPRPAVASTDANVPLALGIPAVALGAGGRGGGAHTLDEWYENEQGALGLERALLVVAAACEG